MIRILISRIVWHRERERASGDEERKATSTRDKRGGKGKLMLAHTITQKGVDAQDEEGQRMDGRA